MSFSRWAMGWATLTSAALGACAPGSVDEPPSLERVASAIGQGPWTLNGDKAPPQLTGQTATLLADGARVIVAGGNVATGAAQPDVYLFQHAPEKHAVSVRPIGRLGMARAFHTVTTLASGKVLAVGGESPDPMASAELAEPASIVVPRPGIVITSFASPMANPRSRHAAQLLADGRVLVVGGRGPTAQELSTAEVYDPTTDKWSPLPPMAKGRVFPTATTLKDGKVLVLGGSDPSAELFDPTTGTWSSAGKLSEPHLGHVAAQLPSGNVLVTGGFRELQASTALVSTSSEVFDVKSRTFKPAAAMPTQRGNAVATVLPSGRVMVTGGRLELTPLNYVEVYDEGSNAWSTASPMILPHALHTATLLPNADVLVTGSAAAEVFAPVVQGQACAFGPDCTSGFCADGICCNAACTGACERCDTASAKGVCTAVSGAFNHCPSVGDICMQGKCGPSAGTTCSVDRLSTLDKEGKAASCGPFVCDNSVGACLKACITSIDCSPGNVCGSGTCIAAPSAAGGDSGCTAGRSSPAASCAALAGVVALLVAGHRRRARRA